MIPDYVLENENWPLRWKNWNDFLKGKEKIRYTKKNKTAIICIFFKSTENIRILSDYIYREEKREEFDFVIIDNSQGIEFDFAKELKNNNVIIISTIANLWTDGCDSLWLEYAIHNWYDYVFLVEDDVVFLDDQAFSSVYERMNKKTLWYLSSVINYPQQHSCSYQFMCYPIDFLKQCWTIDPRFFTRWGDGEWEPRIDIMIKKYWYKKTIVNKRHFHPYLKKNNRSSWRIYFARRNMLWLIKVTRTLSIVNIMLLYMYIRSWYTKLFLGKSANDLRSLFFAIKDFLFAHKTLNLSLNRIKQLYKSPTGISEDRKELTIGIDKIKDYTNGLFVIWWPSSTWIWISWFTNQDLEYIKRSTKMSAFFRKWIVIPNINSPLYPIALLSKKIVTINEFDIYKNTADISIFQNERRFEITRVIRIIIALLLWTITFIIVMIPIFIKTIVYRFLKNNIHAWWKK